MTTPVQPEELEEMATMEALEKAATAAPIFWWGV